MSNSIFRSDEGITGKVWRLTALLGVVIGGAMFADFPSQAGMSHEDYMQALKIANQKVEMTRRRGESSGALSSSIVRKLYGRYYQVGDSWDVAAWQFDQPTARMTGEPDKLQVKKGLSAVFRYEVTEVKSAPEPAITVKITQLTDAAQGLKPADPRVEFLSLTMSESLSQKKKRYQFSGRAQPVTVNSDGIHSGVTVLELFPLDAPDVITVDGKAVSSIPALPPQTQDFADRIRFQPDLSRSLWFEQDDFFGRPVQILWQQGDPWPAYMKTVNGVGILVRKGRL